MFRRLPALAALCAASIVLRGAAPAPPDVRPIAWSDLAPLHARLTAAGLSGATFPSFVERIRKSNEQRVREGDLDHLIFYLLQSTRFTKLPPIEPALSAKAFVERGVPDAVKARTAAFLRALDGSTGDARLAYFRELAGHAFPDRERRESALLDEYARVMKFVYEKEFVAQRSAQPADAVAELYRTRGLSTDTAVEAGFLVHQGLAVVKALGPDRRIRRVLIVGPGLDLAPRTGFDDARAPESYQPWAVIDAVIGLGLSRADDLEVVAADINPRVVNHLRRARNAPPSLTFVTEVRESDTVSLSADYREYVRQLGGTLGPRTGREVSVNERTARVLHAEQLDVVTARLTGPPFDLIIATNVLPYFDDVQLMLAMTNIAGMLAPGGAFLHNEARPAMHAITKALGMPLEQSRHAIIAAVKGAPPLADGVWIHRKTPESGNDFGFSFTNIAQQSG